jgi:hypothetical protein
MAEKKRCVAKLRRYDIPTYLFCSYLLELTDFQMQEKKTGFCRKRLRQTGSSWTLIDWKSVQTTYVPLWDRMEGARLWTLV